MKKAIHFLILFIIYVNVNAQTSFQKVIGGAYDDEAWCVEQTADQGYIICGLSKSFSNNANKDAYVVKTDLNGNVVWENAFGGIGDQALYFIEQTNDGGYIATGTDNKTGTINIFIIRLDANGNVVWMKNLTDYPGYGWSIKQLQDNNFVVVGYINNSPNQEAFVAKLDNSGTIIWQKSYGDATNNDFGNVVELVNGDIVCVGSTNCSSTFGIHPGTGKHDGIVVKLDKNGNYIKAFETGGTDNESFRSIAVSPYGDFYLAGNSWETGNSTCNYTKVDGGLTNYSWLTLSGKLSSNLRCWSNHLTTKGQLISAMANVSPTASESDAHLLLMDTLGVPVWSKSYGGAGADELKSCGEAQDGGYYAAGQTSSYGSGGVDIYLIKTDANGDIPNADCNPVSFTPVITHPKSFIVGNNTANPISKSITAVTNNYNPNPTNFTETLPCTPCSIDVNSVTICQGESATLTASGADTYLWSTNETTASITVSPSVLTNYTVTGTKNGCTSDTTIAVTIITGGSCSTFSCGGSIDLTNVNSSVRLPDNNEYHSSNGFTWECWVKLNTPLINNTESRIMLCAIDVTVCEDILLGFGWYNTGTADRLIFRVDSPGGCGGRNPVSNDYKPAGGFLEDVWYHVAGVMDYSNRESKLYVNGGLVNTIVNNATPIVRAMPLEFNYDEGTKPGYPQTPLDGKMDEVRIWNCVRTDAEILASYDQVLLGTEPSLLAYHRFNDAPNAIDASSNNNDGILNNGAVFSDEEPPPFKNTSGASVRILPLVTTTICLGETLVLTASGADSYVWSDGSTNSTLTITPTVTTTYTVTGKKLNCFSDTTVTITVINSPIVFVKDVTICQGESATLTASGADTYLWSTNETTASISVSPSVLTNYTVTGTKNGCTSDTTIAVTIITGGICSTSSSCGNSMLMDQENSTVRLPLNNQFYDSNGFTWETWFKLNTPLDQNTIKETRVLIGATDNVVNEDIVLGFGFFGIGGAGDHELVFHVDGPNGARDNTINHYAPPGGFVVGTWYHAAGVMDYSNNVHKLYLNGLLVDSKASNIAPITRNMITEFSWDVATKIGYPNQPLNGNMDETRIWNAVRTDAEILAAYDQVLTGTEPNLLVYFDFNETSSTTVKDISSNGNDGTIHNGAMFSTDEPPLFTNTSGAFLSIQPLVGATICSGESILLTASGADSYQWSTGESTETITVLPTSNTSYSVTGTSSGCMSSTSTAITVNPSPSITIDTETICIGSSTIIEAKGADTYLWSTGETSASIVGSPSKIYTIKGTNNFGCSISSTVKAPGVSKPTAAFDFYPYRAGVLNPEVSFTNQSSSDVNYWHWEFGDGDIAAPDIIHPKHTYPAIEASYLVTLTVRNDESCIDTVSHTILISPAFTFFIPNAFTPNNDDVNDGFGGAGDGIVEYELLIFDRWGEQLFYTTNLEGRWKGDYMGKACPGDVYVWKVDILDLYKKHHYYMGRVTLVRQ